ncbi:MAG: phosphoribosylaminoimidazolesuccinocarboxamide synthase [Gammaproteobacteria bacterium]|nr:phosphoribosylaminoimidazolesuccinocarboxamide synthase [Gammaproteobacteria bacterium]
MFSDAQKIKSLPLVREGKVRCLYAVDDNHFLMVATDRVSAFDVILPTPIEGKGRLLTEISLFWFKKTEPIIPNHLADLALEEVLPDPDEYAWAKGRSMLVKRLTPLPVEAIVRGFIAGSGWKDYQASGAVCGVDLPAGLRLTDPLPEPLYTPSSKAAVGDHDENIDFQKTEDLLGPELAEQVKQVSLALYRFAVDYALQRGILIADTKFEFGTNEKGQLVLMDEVLTPDSSRFWPADAWVPGEVPPSFDKQFVRDYLESLSWDKKPPGPTLPAEVIEKTRQKYQDVIHRLTQ